MMPIAKGNKMITAAGITLALLGIIGFIKIGNSPASKNKEVDFVDFAASVTIIFIYAWVVFAGFWLLFKV